MNLVKQCRIWFLVLLAVLVPIRGAVAAAMLCPQGQHEAVVAPAAIGNTEEAAPCPHHHRAADAPALPDDGGSTASADAAACTLCAACCSAASMVPSVPTVPLASGITAMAFPRSSASVPGFISGGQDRPPRSS
jgi:hypothetical protein